MTEVLAFPCCPRAILLMIFFISSLYARVVSRLSQITLIDLPPFSAERLRDAPALGQIAFSLVGIPPSRTELMLFGERRDIFLP